MRRRRDPMNDRKQSMIEDFLRTYNNNAAEKYHSASREYYFHCYYNDLCKAWSTKTNW